MSQKDIEKPSSRRAGAPRFGCDLARAHLKAHQDGELRRLRAWLVRSHLTRCPHCREEAAWLNRLGKQMRTLEAAVPRPELRHRILTSLPDAPPARRANSLPLPRRATFPFPKRGFAFGGALLALAIVGAFAHTYRIHFPLTPTQKSHPIVVSPTPSEQAGYRPFGIKPSVPTEPIPMQPKRMPVVLREDPFLPRAYASATEEYVDPTSRRAEQAFRSLVAHEAVRESQRMHQEWKRQVADSLALKEADGAASQATTPRVAIAVANVETAGKQIGAWVRSVGGSTEAHTLSSQEGPISAREASMVVVRVPVRRSDAIFKMLRHVGPISLFAPATKDVSVRTTPPQAASSTASTPRPDTVENGADNTTPGAPHSVSAFHSSRNTAQKTGTKPVPEFLTVQVLLEHRDSSAN